MKHSIIAIHLTASADDQCVSPFHTMDGTGGPGHAAKQRGFLESHHPELESRKIAHPDHYANSAEIPAYSIQTRIPDRKSATHADMDAAHLPLLLAARRGFANGTTMIHSNEPMIISSPSRSPRCMHTMPVLLESSDFPPFITSWVNSAHFRHSE